MIVSDQWSPFLTAKEHLKEEPLENGEHKDDSQDNQNLLLEIDNALKMSEVAVDVFGKYASVI